MLDTLGLNFHVHLANIFDSVVQRTFLARNFFTIKSCTNLSQVSKTSKMYTSKRHKVNNMILYLLKILRHQNIFLVSKKKSHENYKPISFFFLTFLFCTAFTGIFTGVEIMTGKRKWPAKFYLLSLQNSLLLWKWPVIFFLKKLEKKD